MLASKSVPSAGGHRGQILTLPANVALLRREHAPNQAQQGAGSAIQALRQQDLTNRYQQFLDQQRLPFQQLGWFSDILRGTPASASTQTLYQQPPNVLAQVTGLGGGLASLFGGGK